MHPAKSVILFTTLSGAGYGLLFWFAVLNFVGIMPGAATSAPAVLLLGGFLVTAGLLSSTLHLGHPERAWRALSQWRSSWLSREGVMALLTYLPWIAFAAGWHLSGSTGGWIALAGLAGAACCLVTVYTTAMIYASLKPIEAWSNHWVPAGYLVLALATGAVLLNAVCHWSGGPALVFDLVAAISLAAALLLKIGYWHFLDGKKPASTMESATGLGGGPGGQVRLFEAPHSGDNYLMKEMGFRIARANAGALRLAALVLGFLVPIALTLIGALSANPASPAMATVIAALALAGVLLERWLFFAEARHTQALYYGRGGPK